jgi:site-specific recombinase XerD
MFRWFCEQNWIPSNPARDLDFRRTFSHPTLPFKTEEIQALLRLEPRTPSEVRDGCMIHLFTDTGIRCAELRDLRLDDWQDERLKVKNGKGGKHRILSVGHSTMELLRQYVETCRPVGKEDFLFLTAAGKKLSAGTVAQRLEHWGKKANVENVAPHRFRVAFATRFILHGGDILTLQVLLGHSSLDMTRHYVQLAFAEEAQLTNAVNSWVDDLMGMPASIREEGPIGGLTSQLVPENAKPAKELQHEDVNAMIRRMIEQNNALMSFLINSQSKTPFLTSVPGEPAMVAPDHLRETCLAAGKFESSIHSGSGQFKSRRPNFHS